jgi:hypothetical protein
MSYDSMSVLYHLLVIKSIKIQSTIQIRPSVSQLFLG